MSSHGPTGHSHDVSTPANAQLAALQRQARPRRWLAAAVAGGATGLFANLILDWPLTLFAAIVAVVGLLLWDSRHGTLAGWWPADEGLHRFAAAAALLERCGWTILRIPTAAHRDTTHPTYLLIGPGGVLVVQHQVWTVTDTVTSSPTSGLLLVGGRPAIRRTASVRATAEVVEQALAHNLPGQHPVRAVIAVEGKTLDESRVAAGVTLVPVTDLTRLLRRGAIVLRESDIATIGGTARRLFTRR